MAFTASTIDWLTVLAGSGRLSLVAMAGKCEKPFREFRTSWDVTCMLFPELCCYYDNGTAHLTSRTHHSGPESGIQGLGFSDPARPWIRSVPNPEINIPCPRIWWILELESWFWWKNSWLWKISQGQENSRPSIPEPNSGIFPKEGSGMSNGQSLWRHFENVWSKTNRLPRNGPTRSKEESAWQGGRSVTLSSIWEAQTWMVTHLNVPRSFLTVSRTSELKTSWIPKRLTTSSRSVWRESMQPKLLRGVWKNSPSWKIEFVFNCNAA